MDRALVVIDYTHDFIDEKGALTCGKPGQDLDRRITQIVKQFADAGQYIVVAEDMHYENDPYHPESKLFPPHNLVYSEGRYTWGETGKVVSIIFKELADKHGIESAEVNMKFMAKTRYSAFAGTDLDVRFRERGIKEVHLVGVCTDICVLHTAVDAYNLGYNIVVHADAVASFNPTGHEWALGHFKNTLGAKVVRAGVEVEA